MNFDLRDTAAQGFTVLMIGTILCVCYMYLCTYYDYEYNLKYQYFYSDAWKKSRVILFIISNNG